MGINRHNYEEFFILYLDNELSIEERRQVESFVQLHPDLKEELDLLLQYKLTPDADIVFTGKEELLKQNTNEIAVNLTNYDEWFTLYTDNELTVKEKKAVEQFILENPALKKELVLNQKAKLQPEEIIFTNKEALYRKEEKVRTIPVSWWRVAAAVVLILGISFAMYSVLNKKSSTTGNREEFAKTAAPQKKVKNPVADPKKQEAPVNSPLAFNDTKKETPSRAERSADNRSNNAANNKTDVPAKKQNSIVPVPKEENQFIADNNKTGSNNLPQPINKSNVKSPVSQNETVAINNIKKENVNTSPALNEYVTNNSTSPSNFKQATFKDVTVFDQDENKTSKLRGFFRKITRTLEKRTNIDATDDDEKLLVAGLAIKLK